MRKRIISVGLCLAVIAQMNYTAQAQVAKFSSTSNLIKSDQLFNSNNDVEKNEESVENAENVEDISSQIQTEMDSSFSKVASGSSISLLSDSMQYAGYAVTKDITVSSSNWEYKDDVKYKINIGNSSKIRIDYTVNKTIYNTSIDLDNDKDSSGKPFEKDSVYIFTNSNLKLLPKGHYELTITFFDSEHNVLGTDSISVVCNLDNSYPILTMVNGGRLKYKEDLILKLSDGTGFFSLYNNYSDNVKCTLKTEIGRIPAFDLTPYINGDSIVIPASVISAFKVSQIDKSRTSLLEVFLEFTGSSKDTSTYYLGSFLMYPTEKPVFASDITSTVISSTSSYIGCTYGSGEGYASTIVMDINGRKTTFNTVDGQTDLKIPSNLLSGYKQGDTLNITLTCNDYFKTTKTYSIPYNIPSDAALPSSIDVVYGEDTVIVYGGNPIDELEVRECFAYLGSNLVQFNFVDHGGYFTIPASEITRLKLYGYMSWTNANPELNVSIKAKDGTYKYLTTTLNVYDTVQPEMIDDTIYMTNKDEVYYPNYKDGLGECKVGSRSEPVYYIGSLGVSELSYSALEEAGLTYGKTYTVYMDNGSVSGGSLLFNLYYGISEKGYFENEINPYVWGDSLKLKYNTGTGVTYISKFTKVYINGVAVRFSYKSGVLTIPFAAIQTLRENNSNLRTVSRYQVLATCTDTWGSVSYDIRTAVEIDVPILPKLSISNDLDWKGENITVSLSNGNMDEIASNVAVYLDDSLVGNYPIEENKVTISSKDILQIDVDFKYNNDYSLKLVCDNLSATSFESVLSYLAPRSPSSSLKINSSVSSSTDSLTLNVDMGDGDLSATGVSELRIDGYVISDFTFSDDTIVISSSTLQDFRDNGGTREKDSHEVEVVLDDLNSTRAYGTFNMYASKLPTISESIGSYSFGSEETLVFEYTDGTGDDKVHGISSIKVGDKVITDGITCFDGVITVQASSLNGIPYKELSTLAVVVVFENRYNQVLNTSLYIEEDSIEPSYTGGPLYLVETNFLNIPINEGKNKLKFTNIKGVSLDDYISSKGISYNLGVLTLSSDFFADIKSQNTSIYKTPDHTLSLVLETSIKEVTLSIPVNITETYAPSIATKNITLTDTVPSASIDLKWGSGAELADNISSVKLDSDVLAPSYYYIDEDDLILSLPDHTEYDSSHTISIEFNNRNKTICDLKVLYQVSRESSKLVSEPFIYSGNSDIEIAYDLGSGSKKINGIKEISLGDKVLDSGSYSLVGNSVVISNNAIKDLSLDLIFGETYDLKIVFDNNKEDTLSFIYSEHRVPTINDNSLVYTGGDLIIPVDLGSGDTESSGISNILINNSSVPNKSFLISNGNVVIFEEFIQSIVSGMLKGEEQVVIVEFNNSEHTIATGSFIYNMDRSPSLNLEENNISYDGIGDLTIPVDFGSNGEIPTDITIDGVFLPDGSWSITNGYIVVSKDYIQSLSKDNSFNIKGEHDFCISFGNSLDLSLSITIPVIEILPFINAPSITIGSLENGIDISYDLGFGNSIATGITSVKIDNITLGDESFTFSNGVLHIDLDVVDKDNYGEHIVVVTFDNVLNSQDSFIFNYESPFGDNNDNESSNDSLPPVGSDSEDSTGSSTTEDSTDSSIIDDTTSNDGTTSNEESSDESKAPNMDSDNIYIVSDGDHLDYNGDDILITPDNIDLNEDFTFKIDGISSPIYTVSDRYLEVSSSNFNDKDTGTYSAVVSQDDKSVNFNIKIKVPVVSVNKTIGVGTSYRFAFDNKHKISSISVQSSNKKIATATKGGLVKGNKSGRSRIVYTIRSKTGSIYKVRINLTVKKGVKKYKAKKFKSKTYKTDLPVFGVNRSLHKGSYYQIRILNLSSNAKVTYTSSNKKIASVSKGNVKAKRKGISCITVKVVQNKKVYYYRYNIVVKE
ncbi:MAG TPA: hypothetical protein IAC14_14110 [Candidatus Scybalomonas excrementigallinarum]|nr:hypothetical protein [Candidatus Scybalomonas excrementigallinarum]